MAFLIEQKVGRHVYLYECVSYRNADGQPRSKRTPIGKVNIQTGERCYKPEYVERMRAEGTPLKLSTSEKVFSIEDVRKSSVLECGAYHLLKGIAETNGLADALKEALPKHWKEVYTLAAHFVSNGTPFMHCADWLENTETYPVGDMSSQRISELLTVITPEERENFFQAWCRRRAEEEYLALDITSVSSYSELVEDVEWGYNRDGENLPQINICLLMGEKSRLPIYQTVYSGSLKDVTTLQTTLRRFDRITDGKPMLAVMDKGFYSKKNVDVMLSTDGEQRFLIAVPFTSGFARRQVEAQRKDIDTVEKTLRIGGDTVRAVTAERAWGDGHKVYTHVYFSPSKALARREDIFGHVALLQEEARNTPEKYAHSDEHRKYLNIRKSESAQLGYTVSIRQDAVDAALGMQGWLVVISNDIANAKDAILTYRAKDLVEKGFLRLKCDLDLGRLRVHAQERMQNKVFIGFIALILLSHLHTVMLAHDLYKKLTMRQLLRTLAKLRIQTINGERIVFPPTKLHREIFEAFGIPLPV